MAGVAMPPHAVSGPIKCKRSLLSWALTCEVAECSPLPCIGICGSAYAMAAHDLDGGNRDSLPSAIA
eukprot:scaffold195913_cov28-Tisochrysis_lutea.AAC.2